MTTYTLETQINESKSDNVILQRYKNYIEPFWKSRVSHGVFSGKDSIEISYAYALNPAALGSVVISNGRIESLIKYKELVYNLYHAGYSVFIHDHRGQGLSGRLTTNSHQGFVEDFNDYVEDLKSFYDKVVMPKSADKPFLLCHSMGSAIGALYCLQHSEDFKRVVFSAPMFGIRPAMPDWLAKGLIQFHLGLNRLLSKQPWYFFGQKDYEDGGFVGNNLTHCPTRYQIFRQAYETHPEAKLGGVTGHWLQAAQTAMQAIRQQASEFALPALILQAGDDAVVDNDQQLRIAERMPNCRIKEISFARHELLMESDEHRDPVLREILDFFAE